MTMDAEIAAYRQRLGQVKIIEKKKRGRPKKQADSE